MSMIYNINNNEIKVLIPSSEAIKAAQLKNIKDSEVTGYYTNDKLDLKKDIVDYLSKDLEYLLSKKDIIKVLDYIKENIYPYYKDLYKGNMNNIEEVYKYFNEIEYDYIRIPRMFFSGSSERYFKFNNEDVIIKKFRSILFGDITGFIITIVKEQFYVIKPFIKENWKIILDNKKEKIENQNIPKNPHTYPDIFISDLQIDKIFDVLERKKNIILQGSPGVGKTFIATNILAVHSEFTNPELVQFHQTLSYEDFIQGYRPSESGGFNLKNGIFYNMVKEAIDNPNNKYCVVIDEINRGNLSKIFGELMLLIEADKRSEKYAVTLTYSKEKEKFYIPKNLYIIGTMNTADRSLSMVDYALRRRFAFIDIEPGFSSGKFKDYLLYKEDIEEYFIDNLINKFNLLNDIIESSLGKGFKIGHSYFIGTLDNEKLIQSYNQILEYEIKPLLEEYWFDDELKIKETLEIIAM